MLKRVQMAGGWAEADVRPTSLVRVGDHLAPRSARVAFEGGAERWPALEMELEVLDGRPQCRRLTIRAVPGGREVVDADLDKVRVGQWVEDVYALFALDVSVSADRASGSLRDADLPRAQASMHRARRTWRMTPAHLQEVAAVYLAHRTTKPTKAIEDKWGIAPRTAALWAKRATEAGYLPPTTPGKRRRITEEG